MLLEYRDGAADRHVQARGVSQAAVAEALSQWMRGERGFVAHHEWYCVVTES